MRISPYVIPGLKQTQFQLVRTVNITDIMETVTTYFGIEEEEFKGRSRRRNVSEMRFIFFWLAKKYSKKTLDEIAKKCGAKSHATVLKGIQTLNDLMVNEPALKFKVREIEALL